MKGNIHLPWLLLGALLAGAGCDPFWISDDELCSSPTAWFRDSDRDGYGVESDVIWSCGAQGDHQAFDDVHFDCDDDNPAVSLQCRWQEVKAGWYHACALDTEGEATCWGLNGDGQATPPEGERFSTISAGRIQTCGLRAEDATVTCWGADEYGQSSPSRRQGRMPFTSIAAGGHNSCGVTSDGSGVECWGYFDTAFDSPEFGFVEVAEQVICALDGDGAVSCVGNTRLDEAVTGPLPPFAQVSVFGGQGCGLSQGGELTCFAEARVNPLPEPAWTGTWRQVEVGPFACGIPDDGDPEGGPVECWGESAPVEPEGRFRQISVSNAFGCGLRTDGTLACWGDDRYGETLAPDLRRFLAVGAGGTFSAAWLDSERMVSAGEFDPTWRLAARELYAGTDQLCALLADGRASCWGDDTSGKASPPAGILFSTLDAGAEHGCGVRADPGHAGAILCWGDNTHGEAPATDRQGPFSAVSVGTDHTCGLLIDGAVDCWGDPDLGGVSRAGQYAMVAATATMGTCAIRADDGGIDCWGVNLPPESAYEDASNDTWEDQPTDVGFSFLASGEGHWCALSEDGAVTCWGASAGEGLGFPAWRLEEPSGTYTQLAVGVSHACAATASGSIRCWGGFQDMTGMWDAPDDEDFVALTAGHELSCGLRADGTYRCWGVEPTFPTGLTELSAGGDHLCALTNQGTVCMGGDADGQSSPPLGVTHTAVAAAYRYSCGIDAAGVVTCWGDDTYNQVSGLPADGGYTAIAAGRYQACALDADGVPTCWGDVTGTAPDRRFEQIAVGARHACGLSDGAIACWGDSSEGQLDVASCPSDEPFVTLSAGDNHTCALCGDENVVCWGMDSVGQVSDAQPWRFVAISTGAEHSCGLKSDGVVVCWGRNLEGQAGIDFPWDY